MSRCIIAICGVSLVEEYVADKQRYINPHTGEPFFRDQDRNLLRQVSAQETSRYRREKADLQRRLVRMLTAVAKDESLTTLHRYQRSCAELASLHALGLAEDDQVWLLHSETPKGELCAEVVAQAIEQSILVTRTRTYPHIRRIEGLRIEPFPDEAKQRESVERFRNVGVPNLAWGIYQAWQAAQGKHDQVILCATGGYKSASPYAVLLAMVRGIQVVFLYEESIYPIEIPPLPLTADTSVITDCESAFNAIAPLPPQPVPRSIPAADFWRRTGDAQVEVRASGYVEEVRGEVYLTPLGQLVYLLAYIGGKLESPPAMGPLD